MIKFAKVLKATMAMAVLTLWTSCYEADDVVAQAPDGTVVPDTMPNLKFRLNKGSFGDLLTRNNYNTNNGGIDYTAGSWDNDDDGFGLYVVDESGNIICDNIQIVMHEEEVEPGDYEDVFGSYDGTYIPYNPNYSYYAYMPYDFNNHTATDYKPKGNGHSGKTAEQFFANHISHFTPPENQEGYNEFYKADLMVAKGTCSNGTVTFNMKHLMGLLKIRINGINSSYYSSSLDLTNPTPWFFANFFWLCHTPGQTVALNSEALSPSTVNLTAPPAGMFRQYELQTEYHSLSQATSSDIHRVICSNGHVHFPGAVNCGGVARAMIAYISGTGSGLAIALEDASTSTCTWDNAISAVSSWASGKAINGGTWRLPSIYDWMHMFIGCGSSSTYISEMNSSHDAKKFLNGNFQQYLQQCGTNVESAPYWSSTLYGTSSVWTYRFNQYDTYWIGKTNNYRVRACFEFFPTATTTLDALKTKYNNNEDCSSYIGWFVNPSGTVHQSMLDNDCGIIAFVGKVTTSPYSQGDADASKSGSRILVLALDELGQFAFSTSTSSMSDGPGEYSNGGVSFTTSYNSTDYPAIYASYNYAVARPTNSTCWFLPTRCQLIDMIDKLGSEAITSSSSTGRHGKFWRTNTINGTRYNICYNMAYPYDDSNRYVLQIIEDGSFSKSSANKTRSEDGGPNYRVWFLVRPCFAY